jgi:hypothetical protein
MIENFMNLDFDKFWNACNPSHSLKLGNAEDRRYYIDFSEVRGGKLLTYSNGQLPVRHQINRLANYLPDTLVAVSLLNCRDCKKS